MAEQETEPPAESLTFFVLCNHNTALKLLWHYPPAFA